MGKVKVAAFSVSLDGFGAGANQDRANPLGLRGEDLHKWMFPTKMFQKMMGKDGGTQGADNDFAEKSKCFHSFYSIIHKRRYFFANKKQLLIFFIPIQTGF